MDKEEIIEMAEQAGIIAIADAYRAGVDSGIAAEREVCAALIESYGTWENTEVICQAIRARGEA